MSAKGRSGIQAINLKEGRVFNVERGKVQPRKKDSLLESFLLDPKVVRGWAALRLFALHHHLALVVELSFVPVGAVKEVRLSGCRTCRHLGRSQSVMGSALARAGFTLASFRMCHGNIISSLLMHSNAGQSRRPHHFLSLPMTLVSRRGLLPFHSNKRQRLYRIRRASCATAVRANKDESTRRGVG